jgi:hypothetical protein
LLFAFDVTADVIGFLKYGSTHQNKSPIATHPIKGMDGVKKARHRFGKAHGSPSPEHGCGGHQMGL